MKKYLPFSGIIIFPYMIVLTLVCIFGNFITQNMFYLFLLLLFVLYIVAIISAIIVFIKGITGKKKSLEILHINMVIKLIHIPAYLLIFVIGLLCSITIFTIGITIILMVLDGITIVLTGLIGLGGIIGGLRENKISIKQAAINGILQFVYCADIISSIIIYKTVKASI